VLEINLNAITHNLNYYRNKVGKDTKIMVMVKAFAYGSGSPEIASLLQYHRVDYLSVAYPDEGVVLRRNGIKLPIMVLNSSKDSFHKLFENDLEPEIYSFKILKEFLDFKNNVYPNVNSKIHLKIDTGMHRLGFVGDEIHELCGILKNEHKIEVASIFSHLVGADEAQHNEFSLSQIQNFKSFTQSLTEILKIRPIRHICNSAGITRFPEAKFDMIRLGIGLYGVESSNIDPDALETIGQLKTTISQIKSLHAGETVGYGRSGVLGRDTRIATIAIGYADGFDRRFSKGVGSVIVNGTKCPVVGNVCMDMTMIDVTEVQCQEGDQVIVFGKENNIKDIARSIGTIPYEILTGISERVKRVYYYE
ncbi:MAG: alanine racemase, partial [Leadbetterella sp.]